MKDHSEASDSIADEGNIVSDNDNDSDDLEVRVREWLETSGKKMELQSKLRAELFAAIQTELAFRGDIVSAGADKRNTSKRERLINWLVSEHLTKNKYWMTNSVLVSEAEIEAVNAGANANIGSHLRQYDTEVVTSETIINILANLGFNPHSEMSRIVARNNNGKSVLSNIVEAISSSDVTRDFEGIVPVTRGSVPSNSLRGIDDKYDKIMADVHARRKELTSNGIEDKPCSKCLHLESSLHKLQAEKRAKDDDSVSFDTSLSMSTNHEKISRRKSRKESRKEVEKLCQKIDDLMSSKVKDQSNVANMEERLKQYEQEIERMRAEMKQKEEAFKVHQYEENIKNLNTIIENQSRKILELNTGMEKMKTSFAVQVLKSSGQVECKPQIIPEKKMTQENPIGFLESIRNNLMSLEKEEKLVEDDLEELSFSSSEVKDKVLQQ